MYPGNPGESIGEFLIDSIDQLEDCDSESDYVFELVDSGSDDDVAENALDEFEDDDDTDDVMLSSELLKLRGMLDVYEYSIWDSVLNQKKTITVDTSDCRVLSIYSCCCEKSSSTLQVLSMYTVFFYFQSKKFVG